MNKRILIITQYFPPEVAAGANRAYEGLNANVPLVISDNTASREYFSDAAVFTKITPEEIKNAIDTAIGNRIRIIENSKKIKVERELEFKQLIDKLIIRIKNDFLAV